MNIKLKQNRDKPGCNDNKPALNAPSKKVFGTHEWASSTANFINGCAHDCKYCYSKEMAIRFRRKTPENWKNEEIRTKSLLKKIKPAHGTIMFPSSHDIHPDHLTQSITFLEKLLCSGNRILIVSKPHLHCIKEICNRFSDYKNNILFRFTIGSGNSSVLQFWEPGAPDFSERLAALQLAYNNGFETSVSCEPMLDDNIGSVIEQVVPFVTNYVWIGKANFLLRRLKMNGVADPETTGKAQQLLQLQTNEKIIQLYKAYQSHPKLKWKESIKQIVGIDVPEEKGLDI